MSVKTAAVGSVETDEGYAAFETLVRNRVAGLTGPLFTTDVKPDVLWAAYLGGLPEGRRQHYTCHCCRRFVESYGGLAVVDETGKMSPALWSKTAPFDDQVPEFFSKSVYHLCARVMESRINGVFLDASLSWGTPQTGDWTHLSGVPASPFVAGPLKTAGQAAAEKREDRGVLCRSLADYPHDAAVQAVRVLEAGSVTRSEKALGVARWFMDLHARLAGVKGQYRDNLIWAAAAAAPPGFCHVRTTVLGTLLDDVVAGVPFATIARKWADKTDGLKYQRPTAAPTTGQVAAAEKLVEAMGVAPALRRRFGRLEDVLAKVWEPRPGPADAKPAPGVFGHLLTQPGGVKEVEVGTTPVTWERFARTVLPGAIRLEVKVPSGRGNFYGLTTAADPAAPPILQWDGLPGLPRNPVSSYVYHNGSYASRWGLVAGAWWPVTAAFLAPHQWQEPGKFGHHTRAVHLALAACVDMDGDKCGLCLFPETLRSEMHPVRAVIEAHSKSGTLEDRTGATANGISMTGQGSSLLVRATTATGPALYHIDRLD